MEPTQDAAKAAPDPRSAGAGRSSAYLVFEIEDHRYALPVEQVREVLPSVEIDPLPGATDTLLGVITLRGALVPVADFRRHLGAARRPVAVRDHFLLAEHGGRFVVLPCDQVHGIEQLSREDDADTASLLAGSGRVAFVVRDARGLVLVPDLDGLVTLGGAA